MTPPHWLVPLLALFLSLSSVQCQDLPIAIFPPGETVALEGGAAIITCGSSQEGVELQLLIDGMVVNPENSERLSFDDTPVTFPTDDGNSSFSADVRVFTYSDVTDSENGRMFQCAAGDETSDVTTLRVIVLPPVLIFPPDENVALEGGTAVIVCGSSQEGAEIQLLIDGMVVSPENSERLSFNDTTVTLPFDDGIIGFSVDVRVFTYSDITASENGTTFQCAAGDETSDVTTLRVIDLIIQPSEIISLAGGYATFVCLVQSDMSHLLINGNPTDPQNDPRLSVVQRRSFFDVLPIDQLSLLPPLFFVSYVFGVVTAEDDGTEFQCAVGDATSDVATLVLLPNSIFPPDETVALEGGTAIILCPLQPGFEQQLLINGMVVSPENSERLSFDDTTVTIPTDDENTSFPVDVRVFTYSDIAASENGTMFQCAAGNTTSDVTTLRVIDLIIQPSEIISLAGGYATFVCLVQSDMSHLLINGNPTDPQNDPRLSVVQRRSFFGDLPIDQLSLLPPLFFVSYVFGVVTTEDDGTEFQCAVGNATSDVATLDLLPILILPRDETVALEGGTATIVCGPLQPGFEQQLLINGMVISPENSERLSFDDTTVTIPTDDENTSFPLDVRVFTYSDIAASENGTMFQCAAGNMTSNATTLRVIDLIIQPSEITAPAGGYATFVCLVQSDMSHLLINGNPTDPQNDPRLSVIQRRSFFGDLPIDQLSLLPPLFFVSYVFGVVTAEDDGTEFQCAVGDETSDVATLVLLPILIFPPDETVALEGGTATIVCGPLQPGLELQLLINGMVVSPGNSERLSFDDTTITFPFDDGITDLLVDDENSFPVDMRVFTYSDITASENGTMFQCAAGDMRSNVTVLRVMELIIQPSEIITPAGGYAAFFCLVQSDISQVLINGNPTDPQSDSRLSVIQRRSILEDGIPNDISSLRPSLDFVFYLFGVVNADDDGTEFQCAVGDATSDVATLVVPPIRISPDGVTLEGGLIQPSEITGPVGGFATFFCLVQSNTSQLLINGNLADPQINPRLSVIERRKIFDTLPIDLFSLPSLFIVDYMFGVVTAEDDGTEFQCAVGNETSNVAILVIDGPTPTPPSDVALNNALRVTLEGYTIGNFTGAAQEMFRSVTARIINDYCSDNQGECQTVDISVQRRRRQITTVQPSDVVITNIISNAQGQVQFDMYVQAAGDSQVLGVQALENAVQSGTDVYAMAGFSGVSFNPLVTAPPTASEDSELSTGAIIGIVIGSIIGTVLILLVIVLTILGIAHGRKRRHNAGDKLVTDEKWPDVGEKTYAAQNVPLSAVPSPIGFENPAYQFQEKETEP